MTKIVARKWLVAVGVVSALAVLPGWTTKGVAIVVGSNFATLDPYDVNDTLSQVVAKSLYQGLSSLDKEMKLKNMFAGSYTVSDGGLTYTLKLRQGVKFQNGTDFNADAVKANLNRASNPEDHLEHYSLHKNIDEAEVVDSPVVKITLKQPFSVFINTLAHPAAAMISSAVLGEYDKEVDFHPVGTGSYQLDIWNQTDFMKVKRSAGY